MMNLVKKVNKKVNSIVWSLVFTGILFLILGILIVINDLIFRILTALFIFLVGYTFLSGAYKISQIKKEFDKFFNK